MAGPLGVVKLEECVHTLDVRPPIRGTAAVMSRYEMMLPGGKVARAVVICRASRTMDVAGTWRKY